MKKKLLVVSFGVLLFLLVFFLIVMVREPNLRNDLEILEADGHVVPWGVSLVNPYQSSEVGESIVRVAVIDSGIYPNHPDLEGRVVGQQNTMYPDDDSLIDDVGHGTAVAGIIAANDNGVGIIGVSQNVQLYSIIVTTSDGRVNRQAFIDGIEWAIENNVDIINLSLGFSRDSDELREVISHAIDQGIIVIAASGNTRGMNALFPARYTDVISVGLIDESNELNLMSAIGKIDFVAPGVDILSLTPDGGYDLFDGSSFSAAFVTGIVAEYLSRNDISRNEYRQAAIFDYLISISMPLDDEATRVGNGIPIIPQKSDY